MPNVPTVIKMILRIKTSFLLISTYVAPINLVIIQTTNRKKGS